MGSQSQAIPNIGTEKQPLHVHSSLTPSVVLVVCPSYTVYSIGDRHGKNDASESRPGYVRAALSLVCLDSACSTYSREKFQMVTLGSTK